MAARVLGRELRRIREEAGYGLAQVARRLEKSQSTISRIETGQAPIRERDLRDLLAWYQVTDPQIVERLVSLRQDAQQPGWWRPYEDALPAGMATYAGLEVDATSIDAYEATLVHGLLQTEDYARAVISSFSPASSQVDALVRFRMERQRLLTRDPDPLRLSVVIDEAALRRPVGGPEVMAAQLVHLTQAAARPNVTIQVLPMGVGAHVAMAGSFSVLSFTGIPPVAYVDSIAGNWSTEGAADIDRLTRIFDEVRGAAADPVETPSILERLAKEMMQR